MFKLDFSDSYKYPVSVDYIDASGIKRSGKFTGEFKRLSQEEREDLMRQWVEKTLTDREVAGLVLVGWEGLADADGAPFPYGEEAKSAVLNATEVVMAVLAAWNDATMAKVARKNG